MGSGHGDGLRRRHEDTRTITVVEARTEGIVETLGNARDGRDNFEFPTSVKVLYGKPHLAEGLKVLNQTCERGGQQA